MTIFQKIINREIPSNIVYEDDKVIAILDITPKTTGHTLVIPKNHSTNLLDINTKDLTYIMNKAQEIAKHLLKMLNADGFKLLVNNGASSGQEVFHTHIHIIPTETNKKISPEELKMI